MKSIKRGFKNYGILEFLISLIVLIIFICCFAFFFQQRTKITLLKEQVEKQKSYLKANNELIIKLNDSTASFLNSDAYQLQKDIISVKELNNTLAKKIDDAHNDWLSYIANFWALIGVALGSIAVVFSFKEYIKNEVAKKTARLTGDEVEFVKQNLNEFQKHINLKQEVKIVVLNEKGTDLPKSFKKVMKLYNDYKKIDIKGLENALAPEITDQLKEASLVIIENQVKGKFYWNIKKKEIKKSMSEEEEDQVKKDNEICDKNLNSMVKLANIICSETTLLYYGDGFFPTSRVIEKLQENITFTNAPSQLYGNMLNMLKYKLETGNKEI